MSFPSVSSNVKRFTKKYRQILQDQYRDALNSNNEDSFFDGPKRPLRACVDGSGSSKTLKLDAQVVTYKFCPQPQDIEPFFVWNPDGD